MTSTIIKPEILPARLSAHQLSFGKLQAIRNHANTLSVDGVKDHAGLRKVVKARKFVKKIRLAVMDRRKELNANMLREMRENNFAARYIINELLPVETYCKNIEKEIKNEKEAIKLEKKRLELERLQKRIDALAPYSVVPEVEELTKMTDQEFESFIEKVKKDHEEKQSAQKLQAKLLYEANEKLEQENERLKGELGISYSMDLVPNLPIPEPQPAIETPELSNPIETTPDNSKELLKAYYNGVKAVEVPVLSNEQANFIMLNAQVHIKKGLTLIYNAIK